MEIITGKQKRPQRVVVYGPEGIGKSTFASQFPRPIYIDTEGSTEQLDVARTPKPLSWTMLKQQLAALRKAKQFSTIVIDTVDWAERLCEEQVCAEGNKAGIEDFGYGKGYTYVAEAFGRFLNYLNDMRDEGWNVVLLAHAVMRKFELPDEAGGFDRYELKLSKKVSPLVKEWADMVLFANYRTIVVEVDGKKKGQGGRRVMHTAHHPCWDAKNRHDLPEECPFDYKVIASHIPSGSEITATKPAAAPASSTPEPEDDLPYDKEAADEREAIDNPASTAPKPTGTRIPFDNPGGFPVRLMELMYDSKVSEEDVRRAVAHKGYYPLETPIHRYDDAFVDGVLVAAWPRVCEIIESLKTSTK
jgi:GTPase SAR1 family protein